MIFDHYSNDSASLAGALINTLGAVSGVDSLDSPSALTEFLQRQAAPWAGALPAGNHSDLEGVRSLRTELRSVFEAPDEDTAARLINSILENHGAVPRVSTHGDHPHLHFESTGGGLVSWLGVVTGMGLATLLADGGLERLGVCQAETCDDVYVDTSRNRSRRHCSSTCGTRENVAAYRRRQGSARVDQP